MGMDGGNCETLEFVLETFFDNHVLIIALLCYDMLPGQLA